MNSTAQCAHQPQLAKNSKGASKTKPNTRTHLSARGCTYSGPNSSPRVGRYVLSWLSGRSLLPAGVPMPSSVCLLCGEVTACIVFTMPCLSSGLMSTDMGMTCVPVPANNVPSPALVGNTRPAASDDPPVVLWVTAFSHSTKTTLELSTARPRPEKSHTRHILVVL